jgi:hypothetical protein
MGDAPRTVRIAADGAMASVVVDSTDLSNSLSGYQMEHRAGQPPLLVLHVKPGTSLDFAGYAQVAVAVEEPIGPQVAQWLAGIDPDQLSAAALERDDLDGSRNEITKAILQTLAEWAQTRGA